MVNEMKEANVQEQINGVHLITAWKGKCVLNRNCVHENFGGVTKLKL